MIQTFLFVTLGKEVMRWNVAYRNYGNVARGSKEMKTGSRFAHIYLVCLLMSWSWRQIKR